MLGQQGRQFTTVRRYHTAPPYVQINYPPQPVYDQASPSNFYFQRQQTPYLLLQQPPPFSQLLQPLQLLMHSGFGTTSFCHVLFLRKRRRRFHYLPTSSMVSTRLSTDKQWQGSHLQSFQFWPST